MKVYQRLKHGAGKWRYEAIDEGVGKRTGHLTPPFFARVTVNGKQQWHKLDGETFAAAKEQAERAAHVLIAERRGLTVAEAECIGNRIPLKAAVEHYLELKAGKARKTLSQYRLTLEQFVEASGVRFIDEVSIGILRKYKKHLESEGYAGKTCDTRLNIVYFMLKKFKHPARLPADEMPIVEEEPAVAYEDAELKKLFAAMDDEERIRYKFFLGSACREQEVTFASWQDVDFEKKLFHVRKKPEVGFTPKTHESRTVPLPTSLVEALQARRKNADPAVRWVFPNANGKPDGHFLRKLKQIARRAGLNCGHCAACKDRDECENFFLHRFRKTAATRWNEAGIPVRTIQHYLASLSYL